MDNDKNLSNKTIFQTIKKKGKRLNQIIYKIYLNYIIIESLQSNLGNEGN